VYSEAVRGFAAELTDGQIGARTRDALRNFQVSIGQPARNTSWTCGR
jgi:hypothetical protein